MIKIGCDLVFMPRLEKHLNDTQWIKKILTDNEYAQFLKLKLPRRRLEYFSGRFAAKEAYSKAIYTGIGKVGFHDYEVLTGENGRPINAYSEVTISHDNDYAMAVVLIEE